MNKDILNTGILALAFLSLFVVSEFFYYKLKVKVELTRKFVHIGTGLFTLLFPVMLGNQWLVLLLCVIFAIISIASLKFNFLRSINGIDRESYGTVGYIISVYCCYLVYNHYSLIMPGTDAYTYFYIPILTLAVCDPVAALVGKRFPWGKYSIDKDTKTLAGSLAFFVSSVVLTQFLLSSLSPALMHGLISRKLLAAIVIAALATIAEAFSGKGIDNITIPATVIFILIYLV